MRRISLIALFTVGAIGLIPDTADAQIFRRWRRNNCCEPVAQSACCGGGYAYGGGYVGGPVVASYSDCSPAYAGMPGYPGAPGFAGGPGYAPMPGPGEGNYSAGYPGFAGGQPMPTPNLNVMIRDGAFEPPTINVRVGETVRWTNNGQKVHTVTADDGSFDSGNLEPGKTYSHKFDKQGTVRYHCEPHKDVMKASVVVSASAGGNGSVPIPPPGSGEPLPKDKNQPQRDRDQ